MAWWGNAHLYKRYQCKCRFYTLKGEITTSVVISSNKGVDTRKIARILQNMYPKKDYGRITQSKITVVESKEL